MDRRLEDQEKYDIKVNNQEKERGKEGETARDKEEDRPSMGDRNGERDNGRQVWGRFQMQICCKHTARQAHTHTHRHYQAHPDTLKTQLERDYTCPQAFTERK